MNVFKTEEDDGGEWAYVVQDSGKQHQCFRVRFNRPYLVYRLGDMREDIKI